MEDKMKRHRLEVINCENYGPFSEFMGAKCIFTLKIEGN